MLQPVLDICKFKEGTIHFALTNQIEGLSDLLDDMQTLLLFNEMPPYLEYAVAMPAGDGHLGDVTSQTLSNLFSAAIVLSAISLRGCPGPDTAPQPWLNPTGTRLPEIRRFLKGQLDIDRTDEISPHTTPHTKGKAANMDLKTELSDREMQLLGDFLGRVRGGAIPNIEALDGLFAALACCPDLVMPSEYMPIIQTGTTEDGDLDFESMEEAEQFIELVNRHWNHVNQQLDSKEVYLPLLSEDDTGRVQANHWAQGFLLGTNLRPNIWSEIIADENESGAMVPIWALAYEHHEEPEMRPYDEPISDEQREELIIGAAAGVMRMHRYFLKQRNLYIAPAGTFIRRGRKVGRNEPCPCGSGKKFKKCCGQRSMLH